MKTARLEDRVGLKEPKGALWSNSPTTKDDEARIAEVVFCGENVMNGVLTRASAETLKQEDGREQI